MGHAKLQNFDKIFARGDFSFISDPDNIAHVEQIFRIWVKLRAVDEAEHLHFLEKYMHEMQTFIDWLDAPRISSLKKARQLCLDELKRCIGILKMPPERRDAISSAYLRKFSKTFKSGLTWLFSGIRQAFDHKVIMTTAIAPPQIMRYILDDKEGLGKRYAFNTRGPFSFAGHLNALNKAELAEVIRTLDRNPTREKIGDWIVMGNQDVRIHAISYFYGKMRLYRLYRVNGEHDRHEDDARYKKRKDCAFNAA